MFEWPWARITLFFGTFFVLMIWSYLKTGDWFDWVTGPSAKSPDAPPHRELPRPSLDERLAMLADLRDRGAIGPREYEERRERILGQQREDWRMA